MSFSFHSSCLHIRKQKRESFGHLETNKQGLLSVQTRNKKDRRVWQTDPMRGEGRQKDVALLAWTPTADDDDIDNDNDDEVNANDDGDDNDNDKQTK